MIGEMTEYVMASRKQVSNKSEEQNDMLDALMTARRVVAGKSVPHATFLMLYLILYTDRGVLPRMKSFA